MENRQEFLARLHSDFWQGKAGAHYSENCDHRFEDLFLGKQQEDFQALQAVWESMAGRNIVEVGTNSGLLLQYLTENLPQVGHSVGLDINGEQIARNQQSENFDPRIEFVKADGAQWISENAKPMTLFVSNGGVLEYFQREKVEEMLSHISSDCGPSIFFASEPVAADHDFETSKQSIPFGEECSFSHNYTDVFESNGFHIIHQRAVMYESWKMMSTIAITNNQT